MRHVLAALPRDAADELAVALENDAGDLLEPAVVEVLHDRDDRLLAFSDSDEVEVVDEGLWLARRVRPSDDGQRLAAHLRGKRERLVLHGDHAVDADHGRAKAVDLGEDLTAFQECVVDVAHGVTRVAQSGAQVHEAEGGHDPMTPLPRRALRVDEHNVSSLHHLASCTLIRYDAPENGAGNM